MNTVKIYQLNKLSPQQFQRCKAAQMEAAKVWNVCMETHKAARLSHTQWPGRDELQKATKGGQFELHSQSVQMVVGAFLANIKTTKQLRQTHPQMQMKYPWRTKRFYPVKWPAQAVCKERGRVVLPMGKGRPSLVLPLDLPDQSGACTLVWNNGYELHVCLQVPQAEEAPGTVQATVDLGEIQPSSRYHYHRQGSDHHRARHPFAQAPEDEAPWEDRQEAISLQEVLPALEAIAAREEQTVPKD